MAKIKIKLPDAFQFSTTIQVRITDINYGGHLGNDAVLSILQDARTQYFQRLGFKHEGEGPDGIGIIIRDVGITYLRECFYGSTLKVEMAAQEVSSRYCNLYYKITDLTEGHEVAVAQTGLFFFNYQTRKIAAISEKLHQQLLASHL